MPFNIACISKNEYLSLYFVLFSQHKYLNTLKCTSIKPAETLMMKCPVDTYIFNQKHYYFYDYFY